VLTSEQSYALRAAAIYACEAIVSTARSLSIPDQDLLWVNSITLPELDGWLWAGAKDRVDYRRLGRFSLINTEFLLSEGAQGSDCNLYTTNDVNEYW
jgi:hypothetical protein